MPQKSSMSLILNYKSAVIDTTAAEASLTFTKSGSTDHELPHGFLEIAQVP